MEATITNFIGFEPHWETDHTEMEVRRITGITHYQVAYPDGTKEELFTGLRPGENTGWNLKVIEAAQAWRDAGGVIPEWSEPAPTADRVKAEAAKRILVVCPEWKQRNLTARAVELAIKGASNWTAEEQAELAAGQAIWDQIKAIRAASNALEVMEPIPADFATNDNYWPT